MELKTFREAYDVLQRHAQTLREQEEPNIDDLLEIVNESVAAYKVCKKRIDAVEKALEEALASAGLEEMGRAPRSGGAAEPDAEGPQPGRRSRRPPPSADPASDFEFMDDDIPF